MKLVKILAVINAAVVIWFVGSFLQVAALNTDAPELVPEHNALRMLTKYVEEVRTC